MNPGHHPTDDLLVEHISGASPAAVSLLVATHLSLCSRCRRVASLLDAVGGAALNALPAQGAPEQGLDAFLSRLDAPVEVGPPAPPAGPDWLPQPLRSLVGPLPDASWRTLVPGLAWNLDLPLHHGDRPVRLARMRAGFRVPRHSHAGRELNLVLAGGYTDATGSFERGDLADNDGTVEHELRIDAGEPCVLLVVNDAPLLPRGPVANVLSWLSGGF